MKYIFITCLLLVTSLTARENPFEALKTSTTMGKATYKKDTRKDFSNLKANLPSSARILKSVEFHFQNLDGSLESMNMVVDKKIDWHDELVLKNNNDATPSRTMISLIPIKKVTKSVNFKNIIKFSIDGKSSDKKIRDFLVTNPYKIIIDFKRELSFYTKVYNLKTKYFKSITLGKHNGYYRVAIELDGKYLYSKQKVKDGYIFSLR
jgi:hypothetical protein